MDTITDTVVKFDECKKVLLSKEVDEVLQIDIKDKPCRINSSELSKSISNILKKSENTSFDSKCVFVSPLPLYNNGNNCYINSSIQSLLPSINKELLVALRNARKVNTPAIELFNAYIDQLERNAIGWNVVNNIRNLKYFSKNFRYGAQEDAQEFLNGFLDRLRDEFDTIDRYKGNNNPIRKTFAPSYDCRFYCTKCNKSNMNSASVQEELTFFLELADSVPSMLSMALRSHNNNYTCDYCRTSNGSARMNAVFTSLPQTFICCVKRFKHGLFSGTKIHREVQFSRQIQLPYVDGDQRRGLASYDLSSIVIHLGQTINSGHYECVSRIRGQWYRISDSQVRPVNELQVQISARSTSYIYTYTRSPGPSSLTEMVGQGTYQSQPIQCRHRVGAPGLLRPPMKRKWSWSPGYKPGQHNAGHKQQTHHQWKPGTPVKRPLSDGASNSSPSSNTRIICQHS